MFGGLQHLFMGTKILTSMTNTSGVGPGMPFLPGFWYSVIWGYPSNSWVLVLSCSCPLQVVAGQTLAEEYTSEVHYYSEVLKLTLFHIMYQLKLSLVKQPCIYNSSAFESFYSHPLFTPLSPPILQYTHLQLFSPSF